MCVPNFRSVSFFVWPGGLTQIHTHIEVNIGISSPHVDFHNENPRDASSRSRIFLFSLVYVCMYLFIYVCHASWPNEKQYRPEIRYTHSPRICLNTFFSKNGTLRSASLEKVPFHLDSIII